MNSKTVTTSILVLVAAVLLITLALRIKPAATADSVAVLRTTGMTCSSCADSISKALSPLVGVAATEVDVNGGWVIVGFDTKLVNPDILAEKVKSSGFDSKVQTVITPAQFKQLTGREIGGKSLSSGCGGCCDRANNKS